MKLYFGSLTKYPYLPLINDEDIYDLLGRWRGDNLLRHKTELGRALSFCAGMTLKEAFLDNGLDLLELEIITGDNGKPEANGIEFNLSHSGEMALVAVSDDLNPVGCDIQKVENKQNERLFAIVKRFFSVNELNKMQDVMQKDDEKFKELFYLIFSSKEAYIKMTGEGLKRGMDSFEIPLDDELIASIGEKDSEPIERITVVDGERLKFTYFFPQNVQLLSGKNKSIDKYVAVTCEKVTEWL